MFTARIGTIRTPAELITEIENLLDHCDLRPSEITSSLVVIAGSKIGTCAPRHMVVTITDATADLLVEAVSIGAEHPCKNCLG